MCTPFFLTFRLVYGHSRYEMLVQQQYLFQHCIHPHMQQYLNDVVLGVGALGIYRTAVVTLTAPLPSCWLVRRREQEVLQSVAQCFELPAIQFHLT